MGQEYADLILWAMLNRQRRLNNLDAFVAENLQNLFQVHVIRDGESLH